MGAGEGAPMGADVRVSILLRSAGMLLRRRACSCPLLVVALLCLYRTLIVDRNRTEDQTRILISRLEALKSNTKVQPHLRRALVLTGGPSLSDPALHLVQRLLQQMDFEVHVSRFAETSRIRNTGESGWSLLLCLGKWEQSCLRGRGFPLQKHHMVNLLPGLMDAFSDGGGGLCRFFIRSHLTEPDLPMIPYSCGPTNQTRLAAYSHSPAVATVSVYVVVTSVTPLTSFIHDIAVVRTNRQQRARPMKEAELLKALGSGTSHDALGQIRNVIGQVLQAVTANQKPEDANSCASCFQMLTFTLLLSASGSPLIVQADTEFTFTALTNEDFEQQIARDRILEDTLDFLLSPWKHLPSGRLLEKDGGCRGTFGVCLPHDQLLLLLLFQQRLNKPSAFRQLRPPTCSTSRPVCISDLLMRISCYYQLRATREEAANQKPTGVCVEPRLQQIYSDPPLVLTPPFSASVRTYRAEVSFDAVTVRIRPEPVSSACSAHLDQPRGPKMATFPLSLGDSRITILVTDAAKPVVRAIYTVLVHREARPSLPMFGDHVTCSFLQDCGLPVQPGLQCGLQPHIESQSPFKTCSSGHAPGRWVVPCLSCSDNRTCDWREVVWQPEDCYHPLVPRPLLQECLIDRKVLFIGDSTNRGMMFFLMERVNGSLEDWGKAHDTLVYENLNGGRTQVSYSYYPQFWLERRRRPTFRGALEQLLARSHPLENSNRTVLVVGGVQWLNTNHLITVRETLSRESLGNIQVVVKSLALGFHLPADGVRSLTLTEIQDLFRKNVEILAAAKHHGYEAIDTFSITAGRYKEFLQGRCACHFHEVEKTSKEAEFHPGKPKLGPTKLMMDQESESKPQSYHVRGPVNQVYSEILLSRLCLTVGSDQTELGPSGPSLIPKMQDNQREHKKQIKQGSRTNVPDGG